VSEQTGNTAHRRGILTGVFGALAGTLDQYDVVCLTGLVLLAVGLGVWFSAGVALTVAGALVLLLGVAGATTAKRAAVANGDPADAIPGG
jgi:hypothetical protein